MTDDNEIREHRKGIIRNWQRTEAIAGFRLLGLTLAEMDRAELLGVICFLLEQSNFGLLVRGVNTGVKEETK